MSDEHEDVDEGPKVPKKRSRRDPNQPYPKARPKRRLILKTAAAALVALGIVWTTGYSMKIGKPPWEWGEEETAGLGDYVQEQVEEAKSNLEKVDWGKFGEQTKALWEKVPDLEKKLEAKLATLREKKATAPSTSGSDASEPPAAVEPPPPTELELGCEAMRDGIRHYRKSMNSQKELKKARDKFEKAQTHLERAQSEATDAAERQEIAGYQQDCQQYLYDCIKLEKVGG
jgi:hypothetical protein